MDSFNQEKRLNDFRAEISQSFLNSLYSDVSFLVENETFPGHKTILASRCSHFAEIFSSKFERKGSFC